MSDEKKRPKPRKPAPSKIQTEKPPTANSQPPTEKMEVHHHPQLEHKSKPWKEYLLEGMMIFVAVTMGFFAESYREHLSDRAKEKEFMYSMIEDLKSDTASINKRLTNFNAIFKVTDTILTALKADKPNTAVIYRAISNHFWTYTGYSYNNRTVQQLKNAGNFRLVQNKNVANAILKYDNYQNTILLTQYTDLKNTMMDYKDAEAKVIFYKQLTLPENSSLATLNSAGFVHTVSPTLITTDKALISLYYNRLFIHEVLVDTFMRNIKLGSANAVTLMALIKKEYHLEDE